ncbi:MAG: PocR ligand-binding domain-containing protein, partial [Lachnospiraceae bacterium]
MEQIKLTDLISTETLQQIQNGFSEFTGMAALTTDIEGVPVTEGSGFTRFCMELTRKSQVGCRNCENCDKAKAIQTV